jgi:hypothetical protein
MTKYFLFINILFFCLLICIIFLYRVLDDKIEIIEKELVCGIGLYFVSTRGPVEAFLPGPKHFELFI